MEYIPTTQLSKRVERFDGDKLYTVVSLPKGMEIAKDGEFIVTECVPTIAIIDKFIQPESEVNGIKWLLSQLSHGYFVAKYAINGLEDTVGLLAFDSRDYFRLERIDSRDNPKNNVVEALKQLVKLQKQYHNIVAVNLSMSMYCYFTFIEKEFGIPRQEIKARKRELLELIKNNPDKMGSSVRNPLLPSIQAIDELIEMGTQVYISSGNNPVYNFDKNEDYRTINLLALSNAHIVSSNDTDTDEEYMSTAEARGTHRFKRIFDKRGKYLYMTDGIIRLYPDELPSKPRITLLDILFPYSILGKRTIFGTSFASPIKLNEDLKAKLNKK